LATPRGVGPAECLQGKPREITLTVRFSGPGFAEAELLGIGHPESFHQEAGAGVEAEADDLPVVVDGGDRALAGEFLRLLDEGFAVFPLDGGKRVAVSLRDAEGVVVEFAGDVGFVGGDPDESPGAVGFKEDLLTAGEAFGHGVGSEGIRSHLFQSARGAF